MQEKIISFFYVILKSRHRHLGISIGIGLGIGIGIAKILFLLYKIFYEKIGHLCQNTTVLFLVLIYSASASFCYSYSFLFHFYLVSTNLTSKTYVVESVEFLWISAVVHCLEHLFCREPASASFCRREIHRRGYIWSFKSTQGRRLQFAGLQ